MHILVKVSDIFQYLCTWTLVKSCKHKLSLIISSLHAGLGNRCYSIIKYRMLLFMMILIAWFAKLLGNPGLIILFANTSLSVTSALSANLHYHFFALTRTFGRQICNFLFKQHVRSKKFEICVNERWGNSQEHLLSLPYWGETKMRHFPTHNPEMNKRAGERHKQIFKRVFLHLKDIITQTPAQWCWRFGIWGQYRALNFCLNN